MDMITEYTVRVKRAWVGVHKGQVLNVTKRRRSALKKRGMIVDVVEEKTAALVSKAKKAVKKKVK